MRGMVMFVFMFSSICFCAIHHVPQEYSTIQEAVDVCEDGDVVVVADGLYSGAGNRDITFEAKRLTVRSENGPDNCIIDCSEEDAGVEAPYCYHRGFYLDGGQRENTVIEGFTICNGVAYGGGAIYCDDAQPTIRNCRIVNNRAVGAGLGLLSSKSIPPGVTGLGAGKIELGLLWLRGHGGGILLATGGQIIDCEIVENEASRGGGVFCADNSSIVNCTIIDNAAEQGGGIYWRMGERRQNKTRNCSLLYDSVIRGNEAPRGGQIAVEGARSVYGRAGMPMSGRKNPEIEWLRGNIVYTGRTFDMALNGMGAFALGNVKQPAGRLTRGRTSRTPVRKGRGRTDESANKKDVTLYTRHGQFELNGEGRLVHVASGGFLYRHGTTGEEGGFQSAGDPFLRVDTELTIPARATSRIELQGNLRSTTPNATISYSITPYTAFSYRGERNFVVSKMALTTGGHVAGYDTRIVELDQLSGAIGSENGVLEIRGFNRVGTKVVDSIEIDENSTVNDLVYRINSAFEGSSAELIGGRIELRDDEVGYSLTEIVSMDYFSSTGNDLFVSLMDFEIFRFGSRDRKDFNITIYDEQGKAHVLAGCFLRTDETNVWDIVFRQNQHRVSDGCTFEVVDHRIAGLCFNVDGSFAGILSGDSEISLRFHDEEGTIQTIEIYPGEAGSFWGVTQFASEQSSAAALMQDGYAAGEFASLHFDDSGMMFFTYTNGIRKNAGQIAIASFLFPEYMKNVENDCWMATIEAGTVSYDSYAYLLDRSLEERIPTIVGNPYVYMRKNNIEGSIGGMSFRNGEALKAVVWGGGNYDGVIWPK